VKITPLKPTTAVGYLAAVIVAASAAPAAAAPVCHGTVTGKGKTWAFEGSGKNIGCGFMGRSTQAFVRKGKEPAGFSCERTATRGLCRRDKGPDSVFVFYVVKKR
jgi:hypothetical protein